MLGCTTISQDAFGCSLFTYRGNVVAIDLLGAGLPLLLSLAFVIVLLVRSKFQIRRRRLIIYTLLTVGLGSAVAIEYTLWDSIYGGITVSTSLILYTVLVPFGVLAFLLLDKSPKPTFSFRQLYIVGTVGTVLSDLFRIFSGALNITPLIIGGGGPYDGVILDGLLLILGYMFGAAAYLTFIRRKDGNSRVTDSSVKVSPYSSCIKGFTVLPQGNHPELGGVHSSRSALRRKRTSLLSGECV